MVCIRNDLKLHTQQLELRSNYKFRESLKPQIHDTGPVIRSRSKPFKPESEVEDGEFATTMKKEELLNHDNCTWLSSGSSSPSSCFKDSSLSPYMDPKIDAWFIALLSTQPPSPDTVLNTKTTFFDGSRVNPIEEASLVLDQRKNADENIVFVENLEEEEVVLWLKDESPNAGKFRSRSMSMSTSYFTDSSDGRSLFSSSSSSDHSLEVIDLGDTSIDKLLFWPLDSASDWSSETKWDHFIMSPRKYTNKVSDSPKTTYRKADTEQDCRRRLEFSSASSSSSNTFSGTNMVATERGEFDCLTERSVSRHKIVLEDLLLAEELVAGSVIEEVLGLGEFDGHEGVGYEFSKDEFSLWV